MTVKIVVAVDKDYSVIVWPSKARALAEWRERVEDNSDPDEPTPTDEELWYSFSNNFFNVEEVEIEEFIEPVAGYFEEED